VDKCKDEQEADLFEFMKVLIAKRMKICHIKKTKMYLIHYIVGSKLTPALCW